MCMVSDTALGNLLKRSLRILFKNGGQMDGFGLSIYNISYVTVQRLTGLKKTDGVD